MGNIKMDGRDFLRLRNQIKGLQDNIPIFFEELTNEIAGRLLGKVKKATPIGKYSRDVNFTTKDGKEVSFRTSYKKRGGTLRKGWTVGNILRNGNNYTVEIINPVEYAWYVENGHRLVNKDKEEVGWVDGKFMFKISKDEMQQDLPNIIKNKLKKLYKEYGLWLIVS